MQRFHEIFNYKSAFRILSKGRVVLAVSAFFSGTTLLFAAPTGGVVTTGNASISSGSSTTTITQTTNKASINWQSFNIAPSESVNFVQPSSSSVTLNRVVGTSNSLIQGALNANGQVFLINPNGVIFGNGAQVNVGGIVATTLNISDADFQAGNYKFSGDSTASVLNMGTINVASGGYAVLAGKNVENSGLIAATLGNVQLTGASAMTLNLNGNSLVNLTIDKGTLDALVANKGIIKADGGIVYLTTQALDTVLNGMVNNTGIIEANSLDMQNGKIVLYAHAGTTNVDGTLSVTNGSLETSGNLLHVSDTTTIKAKSWLLDPTNITIASAGTEPISGNPAGTSTTGDVTISADVIDATLNAGTDVTLSATNNIAVNQDMTWSSTNKLTLAADSINVNNTINNTNVTNGGVYFQAAATSGGSYFGTPNTADKVVFGTDGKVIINNPFQLQWIATALGGKYQLGSNIDASGTALWNGGLGFDPIGYFDFANNMTYAFTGTFDGLGHTIDRLTINRPNTNFVSLFGYTESGSVIKNVGLVGGSVLGNTFVGGLVGYNVSTITNSYTTGNVSGIGMVVGGLVGMSRGNISNSYAIGNVSGTDHVGGLVSYNYGTITNSYATGSVIGNNNVGGLVGYNSASCNITNSYAAGIVSGNTNVGGLLGYNYYGTVSNSYTIGSVNGGTYVGGLVGDNYGGNISNSYVIGSVNGSNYVGGLVGESDSGNISNSYATGSVIGSTNVGGLVGYNSSGTIANSYAAGNVSGNGGLVGYDFLGTTSNSYWDKDTSGLSSSAGGTGLTTVQMKQQSNFLGFDFTNTWISYAGYTYPLLRSFLTPLTVSLTSPLSKTYDKSAYVFGTPTVSYSTTPNSNLFGTVAFSSASSSYINAGIYNNIGLQGLYSNQQGYLITYAGNTLTINPAALSVTANAASKVYGGFDPALTYVVTGLISGDILNGSLSRTTGENVAGGPYAINLGTLNNSNYVINYAGEYLTINKANATVTASSDTTKVYNGTAQSVSGFTATGLVNNETTSVLTGVSATTSATNAGTYTSTASGTDTNYNLTFVNGSLTITPAALSVTLGGTTSKVYDSTNIAAIVTGNYIVTGVHGETFSVNQTTGTYNSANTDASTVTVSLGTSSFSAVGGDLISNYTVPTTVTGIGTITPAALTVSLSGTTTLLPALLRNNHT